MKATKPHKSVAEKMSKASDQVIRSEPKGDPALGKDIKQHGDKELKKKVASKMGEKGKRL